MVSESYKYPDLTSGCPAMVSDSGNSNVKPDLVITD